MGLSNLPGASRPLPSTLSSGAPLVQTRSNFFKQLLSSSTALTRIILPVVASMGLATPALAVPGSLTLSGDYIRIGLNWAGTLGTGGNTRPGILYDGTGTGTFNPDYDYLTPGTPFEAFTVAGTSGGTPFSVTNSNSGPVSPIAGTLTDYSGTAYKGATYDQRGVWTGSYGGLFELTNDYFFNTGGQQLKIETTITATADLEDLVFGRFTDPDAMAAPGDSSVTNNFVGSGSVPASDLVYAEALASKYVIGLYTSSSVTHNAGVSRAPWSSDPHFYLSGENHGYGDNSIGLGFDIGKLDTGESITLSYQYIFGTDIEKAVEESGAGGPRNIADGETHTVDDLASGDVNPVFEGGTLTFTGAAILGTDLTLSTGGGTIDTQAAGAVVTGNISGTGGLTKSGSGTLVLRGANSYTGGTTVSAGTLIGDTGSIGGNVTNNSVLILDQLSDGSFTGAVSGTGSFVKAGPGTLHLGPDASVSNPTVSVIDGRLVVNTDISGSAVSVNGVIGGNGTMGGLIVRTNGTAAPGNSIGELTSATYVIFEEDSNYEVEVNAAGESDRVVASETATLEGGHVRVLAENGDYAPATTYVILTAGEGVTGEFATIDSNLAFLSPVLGYDDNNVYLTLFRNDATFAGLAGTANQRASGRGVDGAFGFGSEVYMNLLGASVAEVRGALDRLSGEIHASSLTAAAQDANLLRQAILGQSRTRREGAGMFWAQAIGNWGDLEGNGNAAGLDQSSYGMLAGAALQVAEGFEVGVALGYTDSDIDAAARGSGKMESKHLAVYGSGNLYGVTLRAGAGYSDFSLDTDRRVAFRGFSETLRAKYDGAVSQLFAEAAYGLSHQNIEIEPFAGIAALWLSKDGFTETGGTAALRDRGDGQDFVWSSLGARIQAVFATSLPVTVHGSLAWQHMLGDRTPLASLSFVAGGTPFAVAGTPLEKDSLAVGGGFDLQLSPQITLGASYGGAFSDRRNDHAAKINLSVGF